MYKGVHEIYESFASGSINQKRGLISYQPDVHLSSHLLVRVLLVRTRIMIIPHIMTTKGSLVRVLEEEDPYNDILHIKGY